MDVGEDLSERSRLENRTAVTDNSSFLSYIDIWSYKTMLQVQGDPMDLIEDLVKEPFGTDVARELSQKSGPFKQGTLYKRIQIIETLREEFVNRGGDVATGKDAVARVLKKWLPSSDSPFRKEVRGRYRYRGFQGAAEQALDVKGRGNVRSDDSSVGAPAPEREIGAGPYEVYAWCLPRYQATSGDRWPIKIGKAGPDGLQRRLSDFHENLPERPRYLLQLRCADEREARDREALLHAWFRSRGQKLNDLPGEEWFLTNPREIEEAVRNIIDADAPSVTGSTLEIEEVIAAAFKDITADEWARIPDDLTERLDDYLYGSDRT